MGGLVGQFGEDGPQPFRTFLGRSLGELWHGGQSLQKSPNRRRRQLVGELMTLQKETVGPPSVRPTMPMSIDLAGTWFPSGELWN
jgi:hypothetical protein